MDTHTTSPPKAQIQLRVGRIAINGRNPRNAEHHLDRVSAPRPHDGSEVACTAQNE
jgi:hypothetical protein